MSHNKNHDSQQLPVGRLGIISPYSCAELGTKVDNYLVSWRKKRHNEGVLYEGYDRDTYLIGSDLPRFGSGEAKGILKESVRGDDIYILVDVCNYSLTYSLAGQTNHMSPDDHYQNLKRIIAAIAGKARRINVIMPFLYESRQHRRTGRESLDCALALQEQIQMGVENIITFDAHDPRIQNAIPLYGFETVQSAYQFIKNLLKKEKDLKLETEIKPNVEMLCDPDKLARVFDNLLRNAVNYSYAGTTIYLSMDYEPIKDEVKICVENHGKTISPDKLDRIFEQFFRLDSSRRSSTGGSGLGLAIAKEIVELHHGTITAESENESIRFTVVLPGVPENLW